MATVIRLQRGGRKKLPFYSIIVTDSRNRRDGAAIEKVGFYNPCSQPEQINVDLERIDEWTSKGAQLSNRVASIVRTARSAA
ncbi:MAG: 30S ribosomal protein S16 [Mariprofundales bacterium]|nr:30S ribosomal protein S16 [Mariprofundales bacterium]